MKDSNRKAMYAKRKKFKIGTKWFDTSTGKIVRVVGNLGDTDYVGVKILDKPSQETFDNLKNDQAIMYGGYTSRKTNVLEPINGRKGQSARVINSLPSWRK